MHEIRLAVRQLVEFLLQRGDIDSRFSGFDRANEGARIHRRLQKQAVPPRAASRAGPTASLRMQRARTSSDRPPNQGVEGCVQ